MPSMTNLTCFPLGTVTTWRGSAMVIPRGPNALLRHHLHMQHARYFENGLPSPSFISNIYLSHKCYFQRPKMGRALIIRRPRPTQGGARQGIRHFPPTIWKLATATATATAAAAVLFCAMVFSRPGPTFLQQPAAGAAGRQQQSSQQSRSR